MSGKSCAESDWKLFRKRLPGWQENYMQGLLKEYAAMLATDKAPSEKFWDLESRIKKDRKKSGVIVYDMSRSKLTTIVCNLLQEGVITADDLEGFSEEFVEDVAWRYTFKDRYSVEAVSEEEPEFDE